MYVTAFQNRLAACPSTRLSSERATFHYTDVAPTSQRADTGAAPFLILRADSWTKPRSRDGCRAAMRRLTSP